MVVGAVGQELLTAVHERRGQRLRVRQDAALVLAEGLGAGQLEADRLGGHDVAQRPALQPREHRLVDRRGVLLAGEDEPRARPGQRLVRRRRDHVGVFHGVGMQAGRDEPREVGHVDHQPRPHLVGDRPEAGRVDHPRVRGRAGDDQPRPVLVGQPLDLVEIDRRVLPAHAVGVDVVEAAGEVHLEAVSEVAAVVEPQAQDGIARLQHREVRGQVGRPARVRLHVRVIGAEQGLGPVDRELLDLVDPLAAAVVALARIALGVLVREHRAGRLEHGRPGEILGGDQLELVALAAELAVDQTGDVGVEVVQARGPEMLEGLFGRGHWAPPRIDSGDSIEGALPRRRRPDRPAAPPAPRR